MIRQRAATLAPIQPLTRQEVSPSQEKISPAPSPAEDENHVYRDDPTLIGACLRGNESAWKELVERYGRLVYSIARRNGLSAIDADDVTQIVFMSLMRQLRSLRKQVCLAAWLITVTNRQSQRFARRNRICSELGETIADESSPLQVQVQRWEQQEMVRRAISQLDRRDRELIINLFLESAPSYAEIASHLGLPEGSIGPTRARAFKKLERILFAMGFEPDY